MDTSAVRAAFDQQIRRCPQSDPSGGRIEQTDQIVRSVSDSEGWNGVTWSDLDSGTADDAIRR